VESGTGLTDVGARWYDPSTGTFASLDPLLETASLGQLNGYTYASANPVDGSDPTGQAIPNGYSGGPPCTTDCNSPVPTQVDTNMGGDTGVGTGTANTGDGVDTTYIAGPTFINAPSSGALHKAIVAAQNKISDGTGWYFAGGDEGIPVTGMEEQERYFQEWVERGLGSSRGTKQG
jgi:RHS repeat-associated protein